MQHVPNPNRQYRASDRAVSPVIGVVLMVAVTVILAATIGTLVFGLAPGSDAHAPIASITIESETGSDNVTLIHDGGDEVDLDDFSLLQDGDVHNNDNLTDVLRSGDRTEINASWNEVSGEIVLRHDPSGDIVARNTIH